MSKSKTQPRQKIKHKNNAATTSPAREVGFVLACIGAERVYVCGDFNEWQPAGLQMIRTPKAGRWEKRLMLPAGRHEYKFVVDGKWQHDPGARENVRNNFGSLNSVLEVMP